MTATLSPELFATCGSFASSVSQTSRKASSTELSVAVKGGRIFGAHDRALPLQPIHLKGPGDLGPESSIYHSSHSIGSQAER
jgi:hypothetical protein